ncbi:EF-hand and coiled-coil domain-containing protein 1 isoform X2 [Herpailurus yagouaroundi]|uniref:EF-hand and coiled-coil domain-containing protein 1 isoform X2 n=1 Tax=Herpailurus yagouaroundi TaxID=1608482 RepID=UPI001AD70C3F|nr:EF-hand and coiled-coil domain-containing protein 1 isoform X2 [Puma yagouaroundi]
MRGGERGGHPEKRERERDSALYPSPLQANRGKTDDPPSRRSCGTRPPPRRSNQTATAKPKPLLPRNSGAAPGSGGAEAPEKRRSAAKEPDGAGREAGMEGAAGDPYRRPARRTQWLLSALAHHYGLDRGVENEIVVLATGLDQYLQEVFHHLDCRGAGRLPRADFRALCAVLGLRAEGAAAGEASGDAAARDANPGDAAAGDAAAGVATDGDADAEEEARLALRAEPPELTFRQFHARLCGYFGTRAGPRLPRGALSEHIETQIRLRRPRRRRRRTPHTPGPDGGPDCPDGGRDGERLARLEEENGSLRELVEDLRAALQSSDARCLALQVGLWKSQAGAQEAGRVGPEVAARELRKARGALAVAEARAGRLRQGQVEVRRRAEEAREAVLRSLGRVRELEALARQVPGLQRWVRRLEGELRRYRSEGTQLPISSQGSPEPEAKSGEPEESGTRSPDTSPEGAWQSDSSSGNRPLDEADGQLFRSVEGQAASDEEEEAEKWQEEQRSLAKVKTLLARLSSCRSGCDEQTAKKLVTYFGHFGSADHACTLGELEARIAVLVEQLGTQGCSEKTLGTPGEEAELQRKVEENEQLRLELQMVETERVRLSLLEEKLVDVVQLLQRLRDLNISKRALGKILLNTLDACKDPTHEGRSGPSAILDALHTALAGCELLRREPSAPASTAPALANPLLISC